MKPTHLKTLSATVDELYSLVAYGKITEPQFCNLISELNDDLKQPVTLAHFVRCDANGVPLEKPCEHDGCYLLTEAEAQKGECNTKKGCTCKILNQYNEAQKSVIFEGWEVLNPRVIQNTKTGDRLSFFPNGNVYYDKKVGNEKYIGLLLCTNPTIADLAAATTENPLKLK